jgi:hypothetical protein
MLRPYKLRGRRVPIPATTTDKAQTQPFDYTDGWYSGNSNDLQPPKTLQYVTDKRFKGRGKFETRKGCDPYTVPVGEAVNVQQTSTAGAGTTTLSTTTRIAEKVTATGSGVATKVEVRLKNDTGSGTVLIELYSDNAGNPGTLIGRTSVDEAVITSTLAYVGERVIQAPTITNGVAYWVVAYLQTSGSGTMIASTTTNTTNAKISTDNGQTWTTAGFSLNVKLYTSTAGGVKGLTRVYRPSGAGTTFFAHGVNVYSVNDGTGVVTSIDAGLNASTTHVRYEFVNDTMYYVDGFGKPRKYNWTTSSAVESCPVNASDLIEHAGLMFYTDAADRTKVVFSNFADYDTFTSTDFIYVPAPKKSDHITALAKLNGVLYIFTQRNKHMLLGQDNATFRLDEAYAQKGTFSRESTVFDENYIYFASDDGIYRFNGTSEKNIAEGILDEYTRLLNKQDIHLQLHNNRLYVWYTPNGQAENTECFVYNTLYDRWESKDLNTYIGRSFARHDTSGLFLQASNRAGVVYYGEQPTNDYNNLGDILQAEVRTHYDHFGKPQQKKRVPYWRPILESVSGRYTMQAGFDTDYNEDPTFSNVALQGTGFTYDDPASLYDAITYAQGGVATDTTLNTLGEAYRWQRRYKHHAAREPFVFSGEVLKIQTKRLR